MKPIKLQFFGLNSYRTLQIIDFDQLGADGLFGIFGPTGSGKSSILDAITLALYGVVERASNNTRGIIHQLDNALEVSFEFELGDGRYLVERRYERNPKDPESVVAKQARFRRLDVSGTEVIASKPQEVNGKVEEILGIGRAEFSRAVVLPQGKFDQFLHLTGADRAAMLEHLFNLEQFGEELVLKVKNEAANWSMQLEKYEGMEQVLGDCSEEAVEQAVLVFKNKNYRYTGLQKDFEAADQTYKETEIVRGLDLKRKIAVERLNQLEQASERINGKQTRLSDAERAESLRELILRQKDLDKKIKEETDIYQRKSHSYSAAVIQHRDAHEEMEVAEKQYNQQLPELQARKVNYQGAQEKQKKMKEIQRSLEERNRELAAVGELIAVTSKEIAVGKNDLDGTRSALEALRQERAKYLVTPDEKELIEKALDSLVCLEESEKRHHESKDNYIRRKTQNDSQWEAIVDKVHQMLPEQVVQAGTNVENYSKPLLDKAEKDLNDARKMQQQALIMNSAAELVKELHDGEPCPVCGSREHPILAQSTARMDEMEIRIDQVESRLKEVRNWESQLLKEWHDWVLQDSLVKESKESMEKTQKEWENLLAEFDNIRGPFDRHQLRKRKQELGDFEKQLHAVDQKWETMQKTQEEIHRELQKLNDSFQSNKILEASAAVALKNYQSQMAELRDEVHQITGGKDLDDLIRYMVETYQKLQKAAEDTKRREAETRSFTEQMAREVAALEGTLTANRKQRDEVNERLAKGLETAGFADAVQAESALLTSEERLAIGREIEEYRNALVIGRDELEKLDQEIGDRVFDEAHYEQVKTERQALLEELERSKEEVTLTKSKVEELQKKQEQWRTLQQQKKAAQKRKNLCEELGNLLRGRKFISFLAQEHLRDMTLEASFQLGRLTGQRYALELAKEKDCEFVIRDDFNGGNRRAISSLSGGEIFMTSLALALALSSKIQLRGRYPLGFFFLDEGFGTLDEEKLDKVMNALEKLHDKNRIVGVISHVRELKERLPRYLEVVPSGEDGSGSRIRGEMGYSGK